ncbi:MAG: dihydrolipoyl dehydrogenase [Desulfosarcinaceae bacterium]|nr:dihydrolipoyl dehydrogenase [Desulfosarcinaceae bacterium]
MTSKIAILGGGPGGYVAAVRAAQRGAAVTLIEKERVGGTCLNWGCIPSKIMKTTAELISHMRQAKAYGISGAGEVAADMVALMARKEKILQTQAKGIEGLLAHHKINLIMGEGRISAPGELQVARAEGGSETVAWDKLIIATGTIPLNIPAFPFDGERILSSNDALCLTAVPSSIVIVGGGVIGCEFASILAAMGSRVTVVEALDRLLPLPSVDAACSKHLQREMKKRKIAFMVKRTVERVEKRGDDLAVTVGPSPFVDAERLTPKEREPLEIAAEKVLVCIGRSPLSGAIGLEKIGVACDERGWIVADAGLRTNVSGVYAIGDILGPERVMLAHVASAEGLVAAENATGGDAKMDYRAVPGAIFTIPEVGNVGLTEAQAREAGMDVRADSVLLRTLGKAQAMGELAGEAKLVSERGSGRILGVHIVGAHATDLIAEGGLAVHNGLTVDQVADTIHAHPTLGEAMLEVSLKAMDMALHG